MTANIQSQAIGLANTTIALGAQLLALYQQITALDQAWSDVNAGATINALGTVAQNADGSLGAADGAPVVTHPISPALYPSLMRSMSANQITVVKTMLDNVATYVNGTAVSATGGVRQALNTASGT